MMAIAGRTPPELQWLQALHQPERVLGWDLSRWQLIVRLSRRLRLLGRLAESVEAAGLMSEVPSVVSPHLTAELRMSRARLKVMAWTVEQMGCTFQDAKHPIVLLKGAAYLAQRISICAGRLPSDLDILVPHHALTQAQERLKEHGWWEVDLDEHDRQYYREWSHEIPPMHHERFGIELDLHHNILPPVAQIRVDDARLLQRLHPSGWSHWMVLAPVDQVLHCAAHLILDWSIVIACAIWSISTACCGTSRGTPSSGRIFVIERTNWG